MTLLTYMLAGAAGGAWCALCLALGRALIPRRGPRWMGDLRPGTTVQGPGVNETWTVVHTALAAERGRPPTLTLELVAGAAPREVPR